MKNDKYIVLLLISTLFVSSCNKTNDDSFSSSSSIEESSIEEESSIDVSSEVDVIKEQFLSYDQIGLSVNVNKLTKYQEVKEDEVVTLQDGCEDVSFNLDLNYTDFDKDDLTKLNASLEIENIDGTFYLDEVKNLDDAYFASYVYENKVYVDYSSSDLREVVNYYLEKHQIEEGVVDPSYDDLPLKFYISNYTFDELVDIALSSGDEALESSSLTTEEMFEILAVIIQLNNEYNFLTFEATKEGSKFTITLDKELIQSIIVDLIIARMNNAAVNKEVVEPFIEEAMSDYEKIDIVVSFVISYQGDLINGDVYVDVLSISETETDITTNQLCIDLSFDVIYEGVITSIPVDTLYLYLPYELNIEENKEN
ncbi:MAG: hypothetical protein ACI31G_04730 [Bacilli bacterium]